MPHPPSATQPNNHTNHCRLIRDLLSNMSGNPVVYPGKQLLQTKW